MRAIAELARPVSAADALVARTRRDATRCGRAGCGRRRRRGPAITVGDLARRRASGSRPTRSATTRTSAPSRRRVRRRRRRRSPSGSARLRAALDGGVVRLDGRAPAARRCDDRQRRRVAQVVGAGLERQAPDTRSPGPARSPPAATRILSTTRSNCSSLTVDDARQQVEVVAGVVGDLDQRASPSESSCHPNPARAEELGADALVVAHADARRR